MSEFRRSFCVINYLMLIFLALRKHNFNIEPANVFKNPQLFATKAFFLNINEISLLSPHIRCQEASATPVKLWQELIFRPGPGLWNFRAAGVKGFQFWAET